MAKIKKLILPLFVILLISSVVLTEGTQVIRSARPSLDLGDLYKYSSWPAGEEEPLPDVESAAKALGLSFFDRVTDINGFNALEGSPFMSTCCIPGSTGAKEHLITIYILEASKDGRQAAAGLMVEVSGYCSLSCSSEELAGLLVKAEGIRSFNANYSMLKDHILKALAVSHYRWFSGNSKGEQALMMSHPLGLDYLILASPDDLRIRLIWPAVSQTAQPMLEVLAAYDSILSDDLLGLQSTVSSNYNALALVNQQQEEGCDTPAPSPGGT